MTLTELLSPVQQLPDEARIKLICIFAENLDEAEEISPLVCVQGLRVATPYGTRGAAETLLPALQTADATLGDACDWSTPLPSDAPIE